MVAVYWPALVVYSDEKSLTTPMLETIILKSCGIDGVPDQVLDLGHILFGHFDARAGGRFQVDGELAGVGLREEGQAEEGIDRQAGDEQAHQERSPSGPGRFSARRTQRS